MNKLGVTICFQMYVCSTWAATLGLKRRGSRGPVAASREALYISGATPAGRVEPTQGGRARARSGSGGEEGGEDAGGDAGGDATWRVAGDGGDDNDSSAFDAAVYAAKVGLYKSN